MLERNKSELNSLKETQSKVDKSTEKGRNEYERYSKEIATAERNVANATTRIAKLSQQQEKARNSLDYYKSGLASAQSELRKLLSQVMLMLEDLKQKASMRKLIRLNYLVYHVNTTN